MGKRPNIHDIQKALLKQAQHLKSSDTEATDSNSSAQPNNIKLDPSTVEKFILLAHYQNTTPEALVQLALDDFLDLRCRQLHAAQEAQKKCTVHTPETSPDQ